MAEKNNRRRKVQRQDWQPHWLVRALYKIWRIAFSALKIAAGAVATVLLIGVICGFVVVNMLGDYLQNDIMAKAEMNLEDYDLEKTSYIYYFDEDGNVQILQQIYASTDRRWASYEELPEDLIHAAVAIEDKRFFEHQGVDWITTVKACINMFFGGSSQFGGSTLTQQLVKNLELMVDEKADDVTVQRKVMEIFKATAFEKTYDKDVVLEWYMNTVYFGEGCWGVKSAAEHYFGKELQDLSTAEMAALVGITNNPSLFSPYRTWKDNKGLNGAERNRVRQLNILGEMLDQEWISREEYEQAKAQVMVFKSGIADEDRWAYCKDVYDDDGALASEGCGYDGAVRTLDKEHTENGDIYLCPECGQRIDVTTDASRSVYSWYVDTVLEDVARELALRDGVTVWNKSVRDRYVMMIGRAGYHIYTPYSAEVQAAVDKIYTNLDEIPTTLGAQQLQSGIVIVDNRTGDIVAMSGGVGEKKYFDAWNRAVDAPLQVGSSIKPLTVYAPAFEAGLITPATLVDDLPIMYNNGSPFPQNDNYTYNYQRTIWRGIVSSINAVAVNTLDALGTQYSYNFAKNNFGLAHLTDHYVNAAGSVFTDVGLSPLGMGALTIGATVREMTSAYATFANNGVYREGRTFTLVLDDEGNEVVRNEQETRKILSEKTVNYMNYCLVSAVNEGTGTAAYLYKELGIEAGGKTGSTQSYKDRYFSGFTGYYTAAVWCGFDTPEKIILTGSDTRNPAARLWRKVMVQIHEGLENIPLYDSSKMEKVTICMESGKLATEACQHDVRTGKNFSRTWEVLVYPEDAPTEFCTQHIMVDYCTNGVANEYCQKFASIGVLRLTDKSLVKMTQARVNELLKASGKGLTSEYLRSDYIYLVDANGNGIPFHGLHNDINQGLNCPYKECTAHTKESWEQYVAEHPWIEDGTQAPELELGPDPWYEEP